MFIDPKDVAICVADDAVGPPPSPAAPPIVQTSLFSFANFRSLVDALNDEYRHTVYTRGRNPTVQAVEARLAALERGEACQCFASGMAAISAVMFGLLRAGDHILFVNQIYGPTLELASHLRRFGIEHDQLLDLDTDAISAALRPSTRMIWLESPGTHLFRVLDISRIAALARPRGALVVIDNSWATPLFQKPLTLGADIVVHTATKYLGGHSDLVAGAVISTEARMQELFYRAGLLNGGILQPFDAWLLLRGLRTLPVRMRQHEEDGLRVAEFLRAHPAVRRVYHPGYAENNEIVRRQLLGFSGLFSFELVRADYESVASVIDALEHFRIAVSWGGVESIVISPNHGDNAAWLDAQRIPHGLVRISVGLEGADLLIEDLARALARVR